MNLTCPHCNTTMPLELLTEDACARELFALIARLDPAVGGQLPAYLGLFKPRLQGLRWSRALALAQEVEELVADAAPAVARGALAQTVEAMREKRQASGWRPLTGHGYLSRVLASEVQRQGQDQGANYSGNYSPQPTSKAGQILAALDNWVTWQDKGGAPAWFVRTVCEGLRSLVLLSLEGQPAADLWGQVIPHWINELWPRREWREDCRFRGAARLAEAFRQAGGHKGRWPQPKDVLEYIPRA
jgi:hypothetical protein